MTYFPCLFARSLSILLVVGLSKEQILFIPQIPSQLTATTDPPSDTMVASSTFPLNGIIKYTFPSGFPYPAQYLRDASTLLCASEVVLFRCWAILRHRDAPQSVRAFTTSQSLV